jgi:[calcium/calmodulin-dependent protein kinase] kinase
VTKRGTDPLLSEEENTAELVEPPTEEEVKRAITGNLSNLLVVVSLLVRNLLALR